jgi:hypothetical protein
MNSKLFRPSFWIALSAGAGIFFHGCATRKPVTSATPAAEGKAALAHAKRSLLVLIPLSDANAAAWLKSFDAHPKLRMVVALSPRFKRLAQDPATHAKVVALQKAGRLEMALQIPNAPLFPLLVNSDDAKDGVPAGTPLPSPAFAFPEDVIQIIASAKADFYKEWHQLPKGLVLPHGAASPALLNLLDKQGFTWIVGALEAPGVDGVYTVGSTALWDATPASAGATVTRVWDERVMKDHTTLSGWILDLEHSDTAAILPSDPSLPAQALSSNIHWARRTWTTRDWKLWIGTAEKNTGWASLRRTREALEKYKNSGQASVKRLDTAFEEMYTAENSNYLAALGNTALPAPAVEERTHEFQATLGTVYHIIGQNLPDDLFEGKESAASNVHVSTNAAVAESLPDGSEHVAIDDPAGDNHGDGHLADPPGGFPIDCLDLRKFEVWASSSQVKFSLQLANTLPATPGKTKLVGPLMDIYIDLNHEPNVGTLALLGGRGLNASVTDAWEYAFQIVGSRVTVYRTQSSGESEQTGVFPAVIRGHAVEFTLPRAVLRGSPKRWGYQVLVMALDPASTLENPQPTHGVTSGNKTLPIYDLLDPPQQTQAALLSEIESGKQHELPFIRPRSAE